MFYSSYLCLKTVGSWSGFSEILRVRIYFVGLGGGCFSTWFIIFLLLIAKLSYGLRQKAELVMLKNGENWRTCSGHVCISLKLLVNNQWGKEGGAEAFAFARFSAPGTPPVSPGLGSTERNEIRRRAKCPGAAPAVPGLRGRCSVLAVPLSVAVGERGRWRCLALCQRLLRSFALTLLPHGRHFRALSSAAAPRSGCLSFCLGRREILSPKSQKLLSFIYLFIFFPPAWLFWEGRHRCCWAFSGLPHFPRSCEVLNGFGSEVTLLPN